ncbi:MAG: DMT family transporter [Porticoccaceae bacterium]|nr:DMT family transporter [Porticoccaceae bacterium]
MNQLSGRWKLGLLLAASTATMWGILPIMLSGLLNTLDPITTTFFRFSLAAILITPYLIVRRRLVNRHKMTTLNLVIKLLSAGLLLTINYALYILGLEKTSAEASQIMMQISPVLLLLAGVWVFKEQFSLLQWCGFIIFFSGLIMFFSPRFDDVFISLSDYGIGLLMLIGAAVSWVGYAIIQKVLLREFNAEETMLVFYWIGALVFLPFSDFDTLGQLTSLQWLLLALCGFNTLIAYGCFSEAMVHIEASRVSAVIAMTPLVTVSIVQLIPIPGIIAEPLFLISLVGAVCVVGGSIITATCKSKS